MYDRQRLTHRPWLFMALLLIVCAGFLAGCGGQSTPPSSTAITQITYTFPGVAQKDETLVQDALNTLLKPEGVAVKLQVIDWGSYQQKVLLNFTSGQPCDVVWTAPWLNNYYQNVANQNFLPLDDLLTKDAPGLYASMPKSIWDAARVQGKIYGVINQQIFVKPFGFTVNKSLADKYSLDVNSVQSYADLEPFLANLKQHEPGITPVGSDPANSASLFTPETYGIDPIGGSLPVGVRATDKSLKVISIYETPEFKQAVELAHKWYLAGYLAKTPDPNSFAKFNAGKVALEPGQVIKPGASAGAGLSFGVYSKSITQPILTTSGVVATLNSICRSSAHPDAAMKFLEALNSNPEVYNMLAKGIEGKHWVWVDKQKKVIGFPQGVTASTNGYFPATDWMFGNQFNAYYQTEDQVGSWEQTKKINDTSLVSVALGFSLDTSPIKSKAATINSAVKQYFTPLMQGLVDPNTALPQALQALKAAGIDDVVAQTQTQINEWAQTKK